MGSVVQVSLVCGIIWCDAQDFFNTDTVVSCAGNAVLVKAHAYIPREKTQEKALSSG